MRNAERRSTLSTGHGPGAGREARLTVVAPPKVRRSRGQATPPVEHIVRAALRIIDRAGLAALTWRALATELDSFTANLYRRIADREQLLDLVYARIIADAALETVPAELAWPDRLREVALRLYRSWSAHPEALPLLNRPRADPRTTVGLVDLVVGELERAGLPPEAVLVAARLYFAAIVHGIDPPIRVEPRTAREVATLTSGEEFPSARRLREAGLRLQERYGEDLARSVFTQQVDLVILGVSARATRAERP